MGRKTLHNNMYIGVGGCRACVGELKGKCTYYVLTTYTHYSDRDTHLGRAQYNVRAWVTGRTPQYQSVRHRLHNYMYTVSRQIKLVLTKHTWILTKPRMMITFLKVLARRRQ